MSENAPGNSNSDMPPDMVGNEYYQLLNEEEFAPDLYGLTAAAESVPDPRTAKLFAPRLTSEEGRQTEPQTDPGDQTDYYRRLIMGEVTEEEQASRRADQERKQRSDAERYTPRPTVDMKLDAFKRLQQARQADPFIEAIVDKHIPRTGGIPDYDAIVDQVRTDADLRYELGSYLLRDKLPRLMTESPHSVPYRVFVNTEKDPARRGYLHLGKINSREYAAMMAMSMIDGTYEDREDSDPIIIDAQRPENTLGQHRLAAKILLGEVPSS